jgi:hypothetical protein
MSVDLSSIEHGVVGLIALGSVVIVGAKILKEEWPGLMSAREPVRNPVARKQRSMDLKIRW